MGGRVPRRAWCGTGRRAAEPAREAGIRVVHLALRHRAERRGRGAARATAAVPARVGRPCRQRAPVRELGRDRRRGRGDRVRARKRAPVGPGERDSSAARSRTPSTRARSAASCGRPAVLPAPAPAVRLVLGEFSGELLGGQRVQAGPAARGADSSSGTRSSRAPCGTCSAASRRASRCSSRATIAQVLARTAPSPAAWPPRRRRAGSRMGARSPCTRSASGRLDEPAALARDAELPSQQRLRRDRAEAHEHARLHERQLGRRATAGRP